MIKSRVPQIKLLVSLIVLVMLIGGIGCQVDQSETDSPMAAAWKVVYSPVKWLGDQVRHRDSGSSYASIQKAREAVYTQIEWLDGQKFQEPDPLSPIDVAIDGVQFTTVQIGRGGDLSGGVSMSGAGIGGGGIGGGGGGGGG